MTIVLTQERKYETKTFNGNFAKKVRICRLPFPETRSLNSLLTVCRWQFEVPTPGWHILTCCALRIGTRPFARRCYACRRLFDEWSIALSSLLMLFLDFVTTIPRSFWWHNCFRGLSSSLCSVVTGWRLLVKLITPHLDVFKSIFQVVRQFTRSFRSFCRPSQSGKSFTRR
jgi:hypothetical protein